MGLFSKKPEPSPERVVNEALAILRELAPDRVFERDGQTIRVPRSESNVLVWNLHDFARLAPANPAWRDELRNLAEQVVAARPSAESRASSGFQLRLRPDARVPAELRTGEYAAERVLGDLWALYGESNDDGISVITWSALEAKSSSRDDLRTVITAMTLGADFTLEDMMTPIEDGIPVFTNAEFHPNIAAALLMPPDFWKPLLGAFATPIKTMLASIPAPSRIFLSPVDEPAVVDIMRKLIDAASSMEEEQLSKDVYRFDGTGWAVVPRQ